MKITAQGIIIGEKCHVLYSPQKGTLCGISKWVNEEDIIQINDLEDIACEACKSQVLKTLCILGSVHTAKSRDIGADVRKFHENKE